MAHRIMAEMQILSSSPFHSISEVTVHISSRKDDQEVYYVGGFGDSKRYGIAKKGLERLMMAAGIEEVSSESRRVELRRWVGKWVGKYTQPDGKEIHLSGEKEIDLAVGGTRWTQRRQIELDEQLKAHGVKAGYFKKLQNGYKKGNEWLKPYHLSEYATIVSVEDMESMTFQAETKATRYVNQASQFGMELAQSGARHRAIRAIMQIGQYTDAQLREPFVVIRSRFDWSAMQAQLGDETVKRLKAAQAAQAMGLPETIIRGLIAAPSITPMVEELAEVSDKLTDPQSMTGPESFADLFGEEPPKGFNGNGDTFICKACGNVLSDYEHDGTMFTISQLVDIGTNLKEDPGVLCGSCLKARKESVTQVEESKQDEKPS